MLPRENKSNTENDLSFQLCNVPLPFKSFSLVGSNAYLITFMLSKRTDSHLLKLKSQHSAGVNSEA